MMTRFSEMFLAVMFVISRNVVVCLLADGYSQFQPAQDSPYIFHLVITDPRNSRLSGSSLSQPRSSSVPADPRARDGRNPSPGPFQIPRPNPPPNQGPIPHNHRVANVPTTMGHPEMVNNLLNQHFAHTGQIPQLGNIHNMAIHRQAMGAGAANPMTIQHHHMQLAMQQHQHAQQVQQARSMSQGQNRGQSPAVALSRQGSRRANEQYPPSSGPAPRSSDETRQNRGQSASNSPPGQNVEVSPRAAPQPRLPQPNLMQQPTPTSTQGTATPNGHNPLAQVGDGIYNYSTSGVTPQGHQWTVTMRGLPGQMAAQPMAMAPVLPMGIPPMFGQPGGQLGGQMPFQAPFPNAWPQYPGFGQPAQQDGGQSRRATPSPQGYGPFQMPRPISPYRYGNDESILRQAEAIAQGASRQTQASSATQTDGQSDGTTPTNTTVPNSIPTSQSPQIYVVTDNGGQPHALLVGPSGPYVTYPLPGDVFSSLAGSTFPTEQLSRDFNNFLTAVYRSTFNRMREAHVQSHRQHHPNPTPTTTIPAHIPPQHFPVIPPGQDNLREAHPDPAVVQPADENQAQPAPARRDPREPDEMRDLLAPVVRNLWLIIQIAGLIYFVGGGSGRIPWRTLMIAGAFLLVWAIQAGHFGDLLGNRANWLRRYLDHVIGAEERDRLARDRDADAVGNANQNAAQQPAAAPVAGRQQQPAPQQQPLQPQQRLDPADVARRLVRDRQEQDAGWVMQQVRTVERTVALLIVSLWPGVGERAVRLQEEREEQVRRAASEAEEQHRRQVEDAAAAAAAANESSEQQQQQEEQENIAGPSTSVVASGVDVGEGNSAGQSVERVNKGKQRAEAGGDEES
jgi:hypothetical protein